ncbi:MAG: tail fiber protein [Pseudomonadota bacterium]
MAAIVYPRVTADDKGSATDILTAIDRVADQVNALSGFASGGMPVGWVAAFLADSIPDGFVRLDGSPIPVADNPILYGMIGNAYNTPIDELSARTNAASCVPIMSGASAPSGAASATSEFSASYPAWRAFDGIATTSGDGWLLSGDSGYLQYAFPVGELRYITAYTIRPRIASATISAPGTWNLIASVTGATWDTLDTRADEARWLADGSGLTYELDLSRMGSAYRFFRLQITKKSSGSTYSGLAELTLMGLTDMPVLTTPEGMFRVPNMGSNPTPIPGGVWCIKAG